MAEEKKKWCRCVHLYGVNEVRVCTKLGIDCPSPKKCVEEHGDDHYKPLEFTKDDSYGFWGF